jgi:hypothetical protein
VQDQDADRGGCGVDFAGIEEQQVIAGGLHQNGGIALRGACLARVKVAQYEPTESTLE